MTRFAEAVEQRPYLIHRCGWSGGEYEELPCPGKIRVPEHRCCDIALAVPRMLFGDAARHPRADGARGNVNGARFENGCQTLWTERYLGKRVVVGQGRQHHIASGKIAMSPTSTPSRSGQIARGQIQFACQRPWAICQWPLYGLKHHGWTENIRDSRGAHA